MRPLFHTGVHFLNDSINPLQLHLYLPSYFVL